jgi:hypothetical protein
MNDRPVVIPGANQPFPEMLHRRRVGDADKARFARFASLNIATQIDGDLQSLQLKIKMPFRLN